MKEEADFVNGVIRGNCGAWFESEHAKIYGKDRKQGLITPKQNYLQKKTQAVVDKFEDLEMPVRIIILKPRQKGSTTYGCALDYTYLRRDSISAVIIGGQLSQVNEAWGMLQTYQKSDTFDWKNVGEVNSRTGAWSHGSKLIQETAGDARAGVGGTHQVLHCFEVARWGEHGVNNSSEVLTNIMKCVPLLPGTMINLESTAEGQTGAFYEHWINAIDAEDFLSGKVELKPGQFVRCFAAWFQFEDSAIKLTAEQKREIENSIDGEAWYIGERDLIKMYGVTGSDGELRLGEEVVEHDLLEQLAWRRWSIEVECKKDINKFERDAPHSWRTAFQKSGRQRFSVPGLAALRQRMMKCVPTHGIIESVGTSLHRVAFRRTDPLESKVTIFEKPTPGCRYLLSVDPMTGETQVGGTDPDMHGVFVLRAGLWDAKGQWRKMATAARIVPCRWDIDFLEPVVWGLSRYYGGAKTSGCKIVIEMNQDKGLTELLKLRNADLYQRELNNLREQRVSKALGYATTVKTRENLVEAMAGVIREWDSPSNGIDILCPHALDQCDNFVRKASGRSEHAEGWHDDDVLGIALGVELIEHATLYVPERNVFGPPGENMGAKRPVASPFS